MPITINSTTVGETASFDTTAHSLAITIADSTNRALFAGLAYRGTAGIATGGITASFGGTAMASVVSTSTGVNWIGVYYLTNPATGANTLTWTITGETLSSLKTAILCVNEALQAVPGTSTSQIIVAGTSAASIVLTPTSADSWVFDTILQNAAAVRETAGANQVLVGTLTGTGLSVGASYETQSGNPAPITMSWESTSTSRWLQCVVAVSPTTTPVTIGIMTPNIFHWGGV